MLRVLAVCAAIAFSAVAAAQTRDLLFDRVPLVTVEEMFGSWPDAHRVHFVDGGVFDQIRAAP